MSILDPALRNVLRTLKLSGMLDTLDARLAQTRDGTLGHLDFLQVLCEDEIARRESAALTPTHPPSPLRRAIDLRIFRLHRQHQTPRSNAARSGRTTLARRR